MKNRWYLMLASGLMAGMLTGCNDNEQAPPPEEPQEETPSVEDPIEKAHDLEEEAGKRD